MQISAIVTLSAFSLLPELAWIFRAMVLGIPSALVIFHVRVGCQHTFFFSFAPFAFLFLPSP